MNARYTPESTTRIRDGEVMRVIITEAVLPGETGKAKQVWHDPEEEEAAAEDLGILKTFPDPTEEMDSGGNTVTPDDSPPDLQIEIFDANDCNCLLPDELAWVRFDADVGEFVPIGSKGLIRIAASEGDHDSDDETGNFVLHQDGEDLKAPADDSSTGSSSSSTGNDAERDNQFVEVQLRGSGAIKDEERTIAYITADKPGEEKLERTGIWILIDPTSVVVVQAPQGGIPAATGYVLGYALCTVLEFVDGKYKDTGRKIRVYNWSTSVIADTGYRIARATATNGVYQVSAVDCEDDRTFVAAEILTEEQDS